MSGQHPESLKKDTFGVVVPRNTRFMLGYMTVMRISKYNSHLQLDIKTCIN